MRKFFEPLAIDKKLSTAPIATTALADVPHGRSGERDQKEKNKIFGREEIFSTPIKDDLVVGPEIISCDEQKNYSTCKCAAKFFWVDHDGRSHCPWCANGGETTACLIAWRDSAGRWHCAGHEPPPKPGTTMRRYLAEFVVARYAPPYDASAEFHWEHLIAKYL